VVVQGPWLKHAYNHLDTWKQQLLIHPDPELVASHPESSDSEDSTMESALDSDEELG
jgi:hypothetical protein